MKEFIFKNCAAGDNSEEARQSHSINTVTKWKRSNSAIESIIEKLYLNDRANLGFIHGDISITDDLTTSKDGKDLTPLLSTNKPQAVNGAVGMLS